MLPRRRQMRHRANKERDQNRADDSEIQEIQEVQRVVIGVVGKNK